jgi:SAM-dependent methyltransferase
MTGEPRSEDLYSRVEYRRLIAWERRIAREGPFLESLLARAPRRTALDLGSGTGEHVAWLAERAERAVGVDSSPSMIESAQEHVTAEGRAFFVEGEAQDAPRLLQGEEPFGLALCIGNVLPHIQDDADLDRLFAAAHDVLAPGGMFLIQLLNYARIVDRGDRHLPLNFRDGDDGKEIVFLRLMSEADEGRILFFPTTLELDPESDEPVSVKATKRVPLRAWMQEDLASACARAGFDVVWYGDMEEGPYERHTSSDLVVLATRAS